MSAPPLDPDDVWKCLAAEAEADAASDFPLSITPEAGRRASTPGGAPGTATVLASAPVAASALPAAVRTAAWGLGAAEVDDSSSASEEEEDAEQPTRRQLLLDRLQALTAERPARGADELSDSDDSEHPSRLPSPDSTSQHLSQLRSREGGTLRQRPRRASLAERRVVSLELALEEAVERLETLGWEREAAEARAAEAEARAARERAAAAAAPPPPSPSQPQPPLRRRRPPSSGAGAGEAARARAKAAELEEALRSSLDALGVRDAQSVTLRASLRSARAEREEARGALEAARLLAAAQSARLQLLHRILGYCLAALALLLVYVLW